MQSVCQFGAGNMEHFPMAAGIDFSLALVL